MKYTIAFILILAFFVGIWFWGKLEKNQTVLSVQTASEPITVEEIFNNENAAKEVPKEKIIVLAATGDVMLGRKVNQTVVSSRNFRWPFEKTFPITTSADITLINLEGPLVKNCPLATSGMIFCGDIRNIEGLKFAGVDVANIANNHISNYGKDGIDTTLNILKEADIITSGNNKIAYKKVKDVQFAFLGYNDIPPFPKEISNAEKSKIFQEVQEARKNSDIVVVSFHWGNEYTTSITTRQKETAHLAIDLGADLVIGNHPHWIQPIEIYKDKLIVYSHGNFVFDQMWSLKTREGIIGLYYFYNKKLTDVKFLPVIIEDFGQPRFANNKESRLILSNIEEESTKLEQENK